MKALNKIIFLFSLLLCTSSCDFLDVDPKGQIPQDQQFEDVQGFKDAMLGVYATIAAPDMYGRNLTYGFVDVAGQVFRGISYTPYLSLFSYNYYDAQTRAICDQIWASFYASIANLNNIIGHIESTSLSSSDFNMMRGEAYALRAFLHFDVARLFAPDIVAYPSSGARLPYSYTFNLENKEVFGLDEYYQNILRDLQTAEELLDNETYDISDASISDYPTRAHRYTYYFNKYAVWALKARVYYTMGDLENAKTYAQKVIDETSQFELSQATIAALNTAKQFPGEKEMIFGVRTNNYHNLSQLVYTTFRVGSDDMYLSPRTDLRDRYNTSQFTAVSTDNRYAAYYSTTGTVQFIRYISQQTEVDRQALQGIPLIRLSEMYYIVAESLYDTDQTAALASLNRVRNSRGLQDIETTLVDTKEKFESEMAIERFREMAGEGQVFFALKHYNKSFIKADGVTEVTPTNSVFVLPIPDTETEFGNINR